MAEEQQEQQEQQAGGQKQEKKGKTRKILTMAAGKSTTSKRGIIGPGDELKPEHFAGGQKKLDAMKASGAAVEKEVPAE